MKKEIPQELIPKVKDWLGKDGKQFFTENHEKHGTVSPVLELKITKDRSIPHCVHFREGMSVRNFMRGTGLCADWDALDYDDNWVEIVELAIGISK